MGHGRPGRVADRPPDTGPKSYWASEGLIGAFLAAGGLSVVTALFAPKVDGRIPLGCSPGVLKASWWWRPCVEYATLKLYEYQTIN